MGKQKEARRKRTKETLPARKVLFKEERITMETIKPYTNGPYTVGMNPGPIVYGENGEQVADCRNIFLSKKEQCENARFIAHACNLLAKQNKT